MSASPKKMSESEKGIEDATSKLAGTEKRIGSRNTDHVLAFSESILLTRWDLSKWIERKLETYVTVSGLFIIILGYLLTSSRIYVSKASLILASIALVLMIGSLLASVLGLGARLQSPVRKEHEYASKSLRTTIGISRYTFDEYLREIQKLTVEEMIEQNVNQTLLINEIILGQTKILKTASSLIVASGVLSSLAIIISVLA